MNSSIIFITGFMGVGKSATGKILADRLGRKFFDTDDMTEKSCGRTIPEIFEKEGEEYFRQAERLSLLNVCEEGLGVVATGGGLASYSDNLELMKVRGTVITLTATPVEILRRVSASDNKRPLLECDDPLEKIVSLLQKRAYYYIKSHYVIDTCGKTNIQVSKEIIERLAL